MICVFSRLNYNLCKSIKPSPQKSIPRYKNKVAKPYQSEQTYFEKNYFGLDCDPEDEMSRGNIRSIHVKKEQDQGFGFVIKGENPVFISDVKPDSAAQKCGLQIGDRILAVNEISIRNFEREKIIAVLAGCGRNPVVTIQDGSNFEQRERLSRMDTTKFDRICERFAHHGDINGLYEQLQDRIKKILLFNTWSTFWFLKKDLFSLQRRCFQNAGMLTGWALFSLE